MSWTLNKQRWAGWGCCLACNDPAPDGGDFCSFGCSTDWHAIVGKPGQDTPRWLHDCDACVYLGRHEKLDLWVCPHPSNPHLASIMAREGDHGAAYAATHPPEAFAGPPEEHVARASRWYALALIRIEEWKISLVRRPAGKVPASRTAG